MKRGIALGLVLCALLAPCAGLAAIEKPPDIQHFLLLGFDFWGDETIGVSYSDVNILASIDTANGRLMVTSLLRDTYIQKPDGAYTRLNNIVRSDGFDAMVASVAAAYDVPVETYLAIGVAGVRRLLDTIGAIEVTVSSSEAEKLQHVHGIRGAGTYALSSGGVMHYMRLRSTAGHDVARTERQRKVLYQVLLKVRDMPIAQLASLGSLLFEEVETNITLKALLSAATAVSALEDAALETLVLPARGTYENVTRHGMAVYEVDWAANRQILHDFLYEGVHAAAQE